MRPGIEPRRKTRTPHTARAVIIAASGALAMGAVGSGPLTARQAATAGTCRISGRAASTATPLPGVSVLVQATDADIIQAATSTETDGTWHLSLPAGTYRVTAELTGFDPATRELVVGAAPCDQTINFQLSLTPRVRRAAAAAPSTPAAPSSAAPSSAATQGRGAQPGTTPQPFGNPHRPDAGDCGHRVHRTARCRSAPASARLLDGRANAGARD